MTTNGRVNGTPVKAVKLTVTCPHCGNSGKVSSDRATGSIRCARCASLFHVDETGAGRLLTESGSPRSEPSKGIPDLDLKIEMAVLGCCLLNKEALPRIIHKLRAPDFAAPHHRIAFGVFIDMYDHGMEIEPLLFSDMLRKVDAFERVGGETFLRAIADNACPTSTVEGHAGIIIEHSAARQSVQITDQFLREAATGKRSPGELVKALTSRLLSIEYVDQSIADDGLIMHPLPRPMSAAAFYGPAGDAVRLFSPESEACPEGIYVNLLAILGHLIGPRPHIYMGSAVHRCNLFSANPGVSGAGRKGTNVTDASWITDQAEHKVKFARGLTSGEGLIGAVNRQHGPVFCLETEFGGTLKCMGRKNNNMADVLKQAWDGQHLSILTRSDPVACEGAFVSMISQMTYGNVRSLFSSEEVEAGLANRFLWVHTYQAQVLERKVDWADLKTRFAPIAQRLRVAIQWGQKETDDNIPLLMTPEAEEAWYKGGIYRRLSSPRMGMYGIATQRRAQQVMRVAMIFAVLDCQHAIELKHITPAVALWDYCDATAAHIWGSPQVEGDVEKIVLVLKTEQARMTKYEINRRAFGGRKRPRELEELLTKAQATGEIVYMPPVKTGGKPRHEWVHRDSL